MALQPAIGAGAAGDAGIGHQEVKGRCVIPGQDLAGQGIGVAHIEQGRAGLRAGGAAGGLGLGQGGWVSADQRQVRARGGPGAGQRRAEAT